MWWDILKSPVIEWEFLGYVNTEDDNNRAVILATLPSKNPIPIKVLFYRRTGDNTSKYENQEAEDFIPGNSFAPFFGFRYDGYLFKPDSINQVGRAGNYKEAANYLNKNVFLTEEGAVMNRDKTNWRTINRIARRKGAQLHPSIE